MANIQSFLNQIMGARYGKDVRSSIANAIDAVNTESNNSVVKVNAAESRINTAVTNANSATTAANAAATSANTAAFNANEAAQAVLDEKYILTARTEMVRSGTARPTAKGNALLEGLRGDGWQRKLTGNQLLNYDAWKIVKTVRGTTVFENNGVTITADSTDAYTEHVGSSFPSGAIILLNEGETITMSWESDATSDNNGVVYIFGNTGHSLTQSVNGKLSYTVQSGETEVRFRFGVSTSGKTIHYKNIMINKGVEVLPYEPYCGGIPSPNPSFKQDIRSTGDMGWFDGEWLQGYYSSDGGAYTSHENYVCSANKIPCKVGDEIKIACDNVNITSTRLRYWYQGKFVGVADEPPFTVPNNVDEFAFMCFNANGIIPSTVGHVCVTINGKYATIVDEVGKNLWSGIHVGYGLDGSGNLAANTSVVTSDFIKVKTGVTYYLSHVAGNSTGRTTVMYDKNKKFIKIKSLVGGNDVSGPCVIDDDNCAYIRTMARIGYETQVEEGTEATPYTPYIHNRTYIPLDEPLRGIGDVKDEISPQEDVYGKHRRFACVDLGTLEWSEYNNRDGIYVASFTGYKPPTNSDYIASALCEIYIMDNVSAVSSGKRDKTIGLSGGGTAIYVYDSSYTDAESFKTSLQGKKLVYELAEPIFTPFEDQTPFYNLQSFDEVTHVSIAGLHEELEPTLTMRFPRHEDGALVTTSYCNSKKAEIRMDKMEAAMLMLCKP